MGRVWHGITCFELQECTAVLKDRAATYLSSVPGGPDCSPPFRGIARSGSAGPAAFEVIVAIGAIEAGAIESELDVVAGSPTWGGMVGRWTPRFWRSSQQRQRRKPGVQCLSAGLSREIPVTGAGRGTLQGSRELHRVPENSRGSVRRVERVRRGDKAINAAFVGVVAGWDELAVSLDSGEYPR